jgi:glycosyltransferase involved in cell wall biosynthesis
MQRCHVLVLPSVFEGFGLVIPEAMATGMPVIASTHTIGPEIVSEGETGFVLAPDDVDNLAARLDWLASHRHQCCQMGRAAAAQAQALSWEAHRDRLGRLITKVWNQT